MSLILTQWKRKIADGYKAIERVDQPRQRFSRCEHNERARAAVRDYITTRMRLYREQSQEKAADAAAAGSQVRDASTDVEGTADALLALSIPCKRISLHDVSSRPQRVQQPPAATGTATHPPTNWEKVEQRRVARVLKAVQAAQQKYNPDQVMAFNEALLVATQA
jgi:hypothetical protein